MTPIRRPTQRVLALVPPDETPAPRPDTPLGMVHAAWTAQVGTITFGRLGKALAPAITQYGAPAVIEAIGRYVRRNAGRPLRAEYLAAEIVRHLTPDETLVGPYGELTPAGRKAYGL